MQASSYRSAATPAPPPIVISTTGLTVWKLLPMLAIVVLLGLFVSHRVELHCNRAAGVCTYVERNVFSEKSGSPVPVADLLSAFVDASNNGSTRVTLRTRQGTVPMTDNFDNRVGDEKRAMVAEVSAFVEGRAPTLDAGYGSNVNAFTFVGPVGLLVLSILVYAWRSMRLTVHGADRRVVLETHAVFGLFRRVRELALKDVDRAVLVPSYAHRYTTYRVALRLTSGEQIPLSAGATSGPAGREAFAARINAALMEPRAPGA